MKKFIAILSIFILTGCQSIPVKPVFPKVANELLRQCPALKTIDTTEVKLSELMKTVSANYTEYHACAVIVDAWQEWYQVQKKIYDDIK
jgi:hypothetical protein